MEQFSYTNQKDVQYYLNTKEVQLRHGKKVPIYFFSKDQRPDTACEMPEGFRVNENPKNGFLTVARIK